MTNNNKVIGYSSGTAIAEQLNKVNTIEQRTTDLELITSEISNEDIETEDDNIIIEDNENNKVVEITKEGVKAKGFFDLNGNPIGGVNVDHENGILIVGGYKYKLIPYEE